MNTDPLQHLPPTESLETVPNSMIIGANLAEQAPAGHGLDSLATYEPVSSDVAAKEEVLKRGLFSRLGEDVSALGHEMAEEGERKKRLGAFLLGVGTQGADRLRGLVVILPATFDRTLEYAGEHGFNGVETAATSGFAVGVVMGAWAYMVGKAFHVSLNEYPKTTETVVKNHPVMMDVLKGAVGGFVKEETENTGQSVTKEKTMAPYEARKSKLGKAMLAVSRGYKAALLYGTTAYVGLAKTSGYSDESTTRLRNTVSAEAAVAMGSIGVGVSAAVTNNFLGLAEDIRDVVSSKPIMLTASMILIGVSAVSNKLSRMGAKKKLDKAYVESHEEVIPMGSTSIAPASE